MSDHRVPRWMAVTLLAAAAYNLAWGSWVVVRPEDLFTWSGIEPPRYPGIWQCVGMIVGVYGIGYAIAARNPLRHWPIVLVGLLGKILGPIGFLWGLLSASPGTLPASWGWTIVTNDLIWWLPFAAILYHAFRAQNEPAGTEVLPVAEANERFRTHRGATIAELSRDGTVLLLFLRHSGCTFCREALADLARDRERLQSAGVIPVLVHMGNNEEATDYFRQYGLEDAHRVSDPDCSLYRSYELRRGRFADLFGPAVWWPGFKAAILRRHGIGKLVGDGFQMGGVFLVRDNRIVQAFRHRTPADRPDYCELAKAA